MTSQVKTAPAQPGVNAPRAETGSLMCMQDDCRLFGTLLNEAPQGILVVDDADTIVFANLAMSVMLLPHSLEEGSPLGTAPSLEAITRIIKDARTRRTRVEGELRLPLPSAKSQTRSIKIRDRMHEWRPRQILLNQRISTIIPEFKNILRGLVGRPER